MTGFCIHVHVNIPSEIWKKNNDDFRVVEIKDDMYMALVNFDKNKSTCSLYRCNCSKEAKETEDELILFRNFCVNF